VRLVDGSCENMESKGHTKVQRCNDGGSGQHSEHRWKGRLNELPPQVSFTSKALGSIVARPAAAVCLGPGACNSKPGPLASRTAQAASWGHGPGSG
jgi:hypothetical protein